jgi:hypothetical protein
VTEHVSCHDVPLCVMLQVSAGSPCASFPHVEAHCAGVPALEKPAHDVGSPWKE